MLDLPIDIGGERFYTKKALTERVRGILNTGQVPRTLEPAEAVVLRELLVWHPHATAKVGSGVQRFEIRENAPHRSRGFWLVRTDGSATDFSYLEILKSGSTYRRGLIDACRFAIRAELQRFADDFFAQAVKPTCPILGIPLTREDAHVDHAPPYTFQRIFDSFVLLNGLDANDESLTDHSTDGVMVPLFASQALRDRFVAYHQSVAQLRVISSEANLKVITAFTRAG